MEKYKLIKTINIDGKAVTELELDLDGLTVDDLERCEKQARAMLAKREHMSTPEVSKKYLSCVAAKAANVRLDVIRSLFGSDYTQVCVLVQNFLLGGDSDSTEEEDEEVGTSSKTPSLTIPTMEDTTEYLPDYSN